MDDHEFLEELEGIKEDIQKLPRPLSPCEYFHGRERFFQVGQFKKAVEIFLAGQQKRFENGKKDPSKRNR